MENNIIWLVKIIFAHLLSDFALQTPKWIADRNQNKIKSRYLYLHIAVTAFTAFLFIGFAYWKIILFITFTHYLIDLGKSYLTPSFSYFVADQVLHTGIIFLCWANHFHLFPNAQGWHQFFVADRFWIYAAGVFFLIWPSGIIIDQATKQWQNRIPNRGLLNAGKYIGIIERLIICVLVYTAHYEAIGLLITAKSILRYTTAQDEEVKTEYLLVGTLISISLAFAVGMLLKHLADIHVL